MDCFLIKISWAYLIWCIASKFSDLGMIIDHVDDRNMIIVGRMDKKKVGDLWLVSGVMVIK